MNKLLLETFDDYRNGTLKFDQLANFNVSKPLNIPIVDFESLVNGSPKLSEVEVISMDNAATAPLMYPAKLYAEFLESNFRSSYARSSGFQEKIVRQSVMKTRKEANSFFGGNLNHMTIFGSNTTCLIALFYNHVIDHDKNPHFIISRLSHSALSLPLRKFKKDGLATWEYMPLNDCFTQDLDLLEKNLIETRKIDQNKKITLLIESVSNATGYESNWKRVIELGEKYNCRVLIDNAQGGAFVEFDLKTYKTDVYIVISGHKVGARDGSGILIGSRFLFERTEGPLLPTAGSVYDYTENREFHLGPPMSLEYGTLNFIAQASLIEIFKMFKTIGLKEMKKGIQKRTSLLLEHLENMPKGTVKVLGCKEHDHQRYGGISFLVYDPETKEEINAPAIAAALSHFHGVTIRSNHLCSPVYIHSLRGINTDMANHIASKSYEAALKESDPNLLSEELFTEFGIKDMTGPYSLWVCRASVGFATTENTINRFAEALMKVITRKEYQHLEQKASLGLPKNPNSKVSNPYMFDYIPAGLTNEMLAYLTEPMIPDYFDEFKELRKME